MSFHNRCSMRAGEKRPFKRAATGPLRAHWSCVRHWRGAIITQPAVASRPNGPLAKLIPNLPVFIRCTNFSCPATRSLPTTRAPLLFAAFCFPPPSSSNIPFQAFQAPSPTIKVILLPCHRSPPPTSSPTSPSPSQPSLPSYARSLSARCDPHRSL